MSADELNAPLGQKPPRKPRLKLPFSLAQAIAALACLFIVVFAGFALFNNDPLGGEPVKRVAITPAAPEKAVTPAPASAATTETAAAASPRTITIIDGSSGTRQNVVIGGDAAPAGDDAVKPGPGINARLLQTTRFGQVPVSADGLTPLSAYATSTPASIAKAATMPSIAIVVGGLGISTERTRQAMLKLPPAVTFAFTPYGNEVADLVNQARAKGHEALLQIPMEPFDYPDNDPGPQTLLTTTTGEQNIDKLMWHMSRIQGYVGVGNYMGGKFVAIDAAMKPVMQEITKRGLAWFDDGSIARNVAGTLARVQNMPYARADLVIDASPTTADVDAALLKLERNAREHGIAIGAASTLPVAIERINAWAEGLASRGIMLVPLSTALQKPRPG